MSLFAELKRRNVFRVAVAYIVLSWLLLQVGDVLFDTLELPSSWNKGLLAILALGLAPAMIFSWVYELTPEGVKKESEIAPAESITVHTARKLDIAVIVLLVMAMGLFALDRISRDDPAPLTADAPPDAAPPTPDVAASISLATGVAVLPFDSLSTDQENAFFATGIHEDVLTYLSRVKDLRVISRTSMENYADSALSVTQIGQELGVSHVLEGSVRRAANRVRVTVQLIDALTDEHVWAENYDRTLDDIFAIQSEIAQNIVVRLERELSPEAIAAVVSTQTTNTEAYELYLQARALVRESINLEHLARQSDLLNQALTLDDQFVGGWVLLAEACGWLVWFGADVDGEHKRCAADAVAKVQELAPGSPEAGAARANYLYQLEQDFRGTIKALEPVLPDLPGDVLVTRRLALAHYHLGNGGTADQLIRKALLMDPADQSTYGLLALNMAFSGRRDEAIAYFDQMVERFPNNRNIRAWQVQERWSHLGDVATAMEWVKDDGMDSWLGGKEYYLICAGEYEAALQFLAGRAEGDNLATVPTRRQMQGWIHRLRGSHDDADKTFEGLTELWREALESSAREAILLGSLAQAAALEGDHQESMVFREQAFKALENDQDVITHDQLRTQLAVALAETGDIEGAWSEIEPMIRKNRWPTEWDLLLDYEFRYYFSELPAYQARVAGLEPIR